MVDENRGRQKEWEDGAVVFYSVRKAINLLVQSYIK